MEAGFVLFLCTLALMALVAPLLAIIALLYVISIPWYRATDAPLRIVFGLPDWVAVAIACYIAVAILNAVAWRLTTISDTPAPAEHPGRGTR